MPQPEQAGPAGLRRRPAGARGTWHPVRGPDMATGSASRPAAGRRRDRLARRARRCLEPRRVRDGPDRLRSARAEARRAYAWLAEPRTGRLLGGVRGRAGPRAEYTESNHAAYCASAYGTSCSSPVTRISPRGCGRWSGRRSSSPWACRRPRRDHLAAAEDGSGQLCAADREASMYQSLGCAIALAERMGEPQPDWELAAAQLGHAVACHGEVFADKSRFSMDWYYPVLGGPVRGAAAERLLKAGWDTYRGAGPGRPLRQRRALGDRCRDLRAGDRARGHRRPG